MKSTNCIKSCFCILLILVLFSCKKENKDTTVDSGFKEKLEWFTKEKNYKNYTVYSVKFKETYNNCIKNKNYENAKLLLYKYGSFISDEVVSDSLFVTTSKDFYNKNFEVKKDTTFAFIYCYCANDYNRNGDFKNSIIWAEKALDINKNLQSSRVNIRAKSTIGNCYISSNEPKKAVQIFSELIAIAEQEKDYRVLGSLNYNLANCYATLNAYNEANKFYKKSANSFLKIKDTMRYFALQAAYAQTEFSNKKDTIATLKFLDSLVTANKRYKKRDEIAAVTLAEIKRLKYLLTKKYDSAFYYNKISYDYYKKSKGYLLDSQFFDNDIYFQKFKKLKNKQETLAMLNDLLKEQQYPDCATLYYQLYRNAKSENNTKEALLYRDKEIELRDSILISNQKGQLFEFDKKYQSEKKEKQIAQQQILISKNKSYIVGLLLALTILVLGTFLFYSRKRKQEAKSETLRQEQFTFQLFQNTEEERSRIANELHDSVNHDLLNIKNNLINGKTINANEVANVIEEVRNISRNLHPAVLETVGLEASIENLCERLTDIGLFTTCDIDYTQKISKNKELQLYRIIQEALNNTLKHGKANAAKVILTSQNNSLQLEVKDNGNGFDVNEQLNNPKSFGLQSIMQRAKAIAAKININSSTNGTIILLKIPV